MPDNKTKKRPQDASRINLNQDYEIKYWCERFNCTKLELEDAVKAVGTSQEAVKDYLKK